MAKAREWLLDCLIPPLAVHTASGPAFFAYTNNKAAVIDGRYVCTLIDPLIEHLPTGSYTYVIIGNVAGPEAIPSQHVPRRLVWKEFLVSLLFLERGDIADYRFVTRLYDSRDLCLLMRPGRYHESRLFRRLFALRVFLLARYFALKFRRVALIAESAHVIVYYNAMMLGVVKAFRKLGKPVRDIQHGYLGPLHDAYNNPVAFSFDSAFKPTGFLVWERRFGEHIETVLGMPWQSTEYHHLRGAGDSEEKRQGRCVILYSLQWSTPVPAEVQQAVSHFGENISWEFRLHPFEKDPRPDLDWVRAVPNATIVDSSQPLLLALRACDLHVTYNSGVTHEAAAIGIPTCFLDPDFSARVERELISGTARFAGNGMLIDTINEFFVKTPHVVGAHDASIVNGRR